MLVPFGTDCDVKGSCQRESPPAAASTARIIL